MLRKIFLVACKFKILVDILHKPCDSRRRPAPVEIPAGRCPAERSALRMSAPAVFGMFFVRLYAVIRLGGLSAGRTHTVKKINQRRNSFTEICIICSPVVHLKVYVYMIVTAPRRTVALVPYALKVCRERACS